MNISLKPTVNPAWVLKTIGVISILLAGIGLAFFPNTALGFALTVVGIGLAFESWYVLRKIKRTPHQT